MALQVQARTRQQELSTPTTFKWTYVACAVKSYWFQGFYHFVMNFSNYSKSSSYHAANGDLVVNHWTQEKMAAHVKIKSPVLYQFLAALVRRAIIEQEIHGLVTEPFPCSNLKSLG